MERLLMLDFFVAFAVRMPIVPVHSWLPDAHVRAPTADSVDFAGILLKTTAYDLVRLALLLSPNTPAEFVPIAVWLGVIGISHDALLSLAQIDIKHLVAYSNISHIGFVMIGIYSGSQVTLQGVVVQMIAHGLSTAALFILCGQLYERLCTCDMRKMGGLWSRMPYLLAISPFPASASLGLPGIGNFVGEFLILIGTFKVALAIIMIATFGLVFTLVYSLIMIHRAYFGSSRSDESTLSLDARELNVVLGLAVLLVLLGVYPQPMLNISAVSMYSVQ